jgi:hypothetical protein
VLMGQGFSARAGGSKFCPVSHVQMKKQLEGVLPVAAEMVAVPRLVAIKLTAYFFPEGPW